MHRTHDRVIERCRRIIAPVTAIRRHHFSLILKNYGIVLSVTALHEKHIDARWPSNINCLWSSTISLNKYREMQAPSARPASREGWRSLSIALHAPRATHSSSIDELNGRRARSYTEYHDSPYKSESLQKDRRSVRYNRFGKGSLRVERISALWAGEACRSAFRSEDRRATNSGLRGHCRALERPIASTRRRARPAIGRSEGSSSPGPASGPSSKTWTLRLTAAKVARERHTQRTARAFEWDAAVPLWRRRCLGCVTLPKYFWWWNASELEHEIELMDGERCLVRCRSPRAGLTRCRLARPAAFLAHTSGII